MPPARAAAHGLDADRDSSNGHAAAEIVPSPPAEVVGEGSGGAHQALSVLEVADRFGVSPSTVKRRARELGGQLGPEGWRFPLLTLQRVTEKVTIGAQREPKATPDAGERDARVFAALEEGRTVAQIVIAEKIPAKVALELRSVWIQAHAADRTGQEFRCSCGSMSDPRTARCVRCFARTRTLTDAEAIVLAGAELPEPGTTTCTGCKATVRTADVDALCTTCTPKLTIAVTGGVLSIMLAGRALRTLSVPEMRALAPEIAHHMPPPAAPTMPEVPVAPIKNGNGEILDVLRELIALPVQLPPEGSPL